ncbi:hypothetical protein [Oleiagrimonas sp. C23AA]|uniref:hypothetical protein n=1 Tax=Oleiagrimonas sp. C23AA TaxID=2719047 RepID=UPI00141F948B|nr:hypothetical protein [Oleiagrimonas sp. C23AA]NII12278.1 hypothetical protein [Oleiagrimonas sp. C23AA]
MKATWRLLALPWQQMRVGTIGVGVLYLAGVAVSMLKTMPGVVIIGLSCMFGGLMLGMTVRGLMRTEVHLLPGFLRHLARAGAWLLIPGVLIPTLLMVHYGPLAMAQTAGGLLLLETAMLGSGSGMMVMLLLWLPMMALQAFPKVAQVIMPPIKHSPLAPLLAILLAAWLLYLTLRPLWQQEERPAAMSPMQALPFRTNSASSREGLRPHSRLAQRLNALFNATSRRALRLALAAFSKQSSRWNRLRLIRAMLLPHDNLAAMGIRFGLTLLFAVLYMSFVGHTQHWSAAGMGAYALMLGMSRLAQVGRGLVQMRPNMAELYMTLGLPSQSQFQATIANTLLWLVPLVLVESLGYGLLTLAILGGTHPLRLLGSLVIAAAGGAFAGLCAQMIGPDTRGGLQGVHIVVILIAEAIYGGVLGLATWLGTALGLSLGVVIVLPFAIGVWLGTRRQYMARVPRFDAPLV